MRTIVRRLLLLISAAALVFAIWLLAESRPPLPPADRLGAAAGADRLLIFLAWIGCLLLAIGLLYRLAARARGNSTVLSAPIRHLHRSEPTTRAPTTSGYPDRPFPLIPRLPALPNERVAEAPTPAPTGVPSPVESDQSKPPDGSQQATISLLGPLTISGGRRRARRLRGGTRELLCYLALRSAGAQRDQIIDALWPDQPPEQGRNRLWRAAADARAHFGETILARDGDRYDLDHTQITVDLDQLDRLLIDLERADESAEQLSLLERALALFNGEPLAGIDFPWAANEQRRLHAIHVDLLERAGCARLATGDAAGALASAEAGLGHEPYNERLARLAMEAEGALGLRGAIINRYEQLTELLGQQVGLQPHRETRRLYRELLGQDTEQAASSSGASSG